MKRAFFLLAFAVILCGCQSSNNPPSAIGLADTVTKWDTAATGIRHASGGFHSRDGLALYFQAWEPIDTMRAVVFLIHGVAEHGGRYARYASMFCSKKYAVSTFDLRGHGRSMGQRGHFPSLDAALDDISLFEKKVKGMYPGKKLFLYGHSLGGNFVLNYSIRRGTSAAGVIASAPFIKTTTEPPVWKMALGRVMNVLWPTFSMPNGLALADVTRDSLTKLSIKNDTLVQNRVSARFIGMFEAGDWLLANADKMKYPLLLMHGDADRITSEQASAHFAQKAGPVCTFKVWPGFYHQIHDEPGREAVCEYVVSWMDSVGK
ncbi:MAG TPA: lysophospholipase [Chitinivibrionales bacterium]|nr:lysophospholipase [Chitinivibrionales bacterium]